MCADIINGGSSVTKSELILQIYILKENINSYRWRTNCNGYLEIINLYQLGIDKQYSDDEYGVTFLSLKLD